MRIGIDARLTFYTQGGIAYYIRQLVKYLPATDPHNDYLILQSWKAKESLSPQRLNCFTPAHHVWERWALGAEMMPQHLSLLHSPDFIPPHGAFKKIITIHDLTFLHYPQFLTPESRRYYNDQIHAAAQQADFILCDSEATRADVLALLKVNERKTRTVHLAPDPKFRPLPTEEVAAVTTRLNLPRQYLLFVGTFEPRKNVANLLRAYATLKNVPPLVLAGNTGWLFAETLKLIEDLQLKEKVFIVQNFSAADVVALYNAALALILPSHYEGFGLPVLEAFACGVPVIISKRASLPELANGCALLCEPDDLASIAYAIQKILEDDALAQELIGKGLKRVKDFSWEKCTRETLESYKFVLSERQ